MKPWMTLPLVLVLAGCLGKVAPGEEYLKVLGPAKQCLDSQNGQTARLSVGIKEFKTSEALDRQAVMLAKGRVLTASSRWFWEASPGALFSQAMAQELACAPGLAAMWPLRWQSRPDLVLAGQVTAFEVHSESLSVSLAVSCQIWDGEESRSLGARDFAAEVKITGLTPEAIAQGAAQALGQTTGQAAAWLENFPFVPSRVK
jgi:ABC-type uncharacterized transport system auxiliary subunit